MQAAVRRADQSLSESVSHSHAVHLSGSNDKGRREEERAPTAQADLCCLFPLLVLRGKYTLSKRQP